MGQEVVTVVGQEVRTETTHGWISLLQDWLLSDSSDSSRTRSCTRLDVTVSIV